MSSINKSPVIQADLPKLRKEAGLPPKTVLDFNTERGAAPNLHAAIHQAAALVFKDMKTNLMLALWMQRDDEYADLPPQDLEHYLAILRKCRESSG